MADRSKENIQTCGELIEALRQFEPATPVRIFREYFISEETGWDSTEDAVRVRDFDNRAILDSDGD